MTDDPRERAEQRTLLMPRRAGGNDLKPGQRRQEFTVERTLGVGAYSIVYLAHDTRLDRRVAIKDYLPAMLAQRMPAGDVAPSLPRFEALFDKGLVGFLNEAKLLGSFDHPGLVKVYRYWAEAGTAYMAMPFYEGVTLRRSLAERGAPPEEAWLRQLAAQLMQALQVLHAARGAYSDASLAAIDGGLAVRPEQRPQSMAALTGLIDSPLAASASVSPPATPMSPSPGAAAGPSKPGGLTAPAVAALLAVVLGLALVAWSLLR